MIYDIQRFLRARKTRDWATLHELAADTGWRWVTRLVRWWERNDEKRRR